MFVFIPLFFICSMVRFFLCCCVGVCVHVWRMLFGMCLDDGVVLGRCLDPGMS